MKEFGIIALMIGLALFNSIIGFSVGYTVGKSEVKTVCMLQDPKTGMYLDRKGNLTHKIDEVKFRFLKRNEYNQFHNYIICEIVDASE